MRVLLVLGPVVAFGLVVACGGKSKPASSATVATIAATAAPALDPANATYVIDGKPVTLTNGKSDVPIAPGSASHRITTLTSTTATGDIDGDGKPDAAVVITDTSGGSGVFSHLAAVLSSGGSGAPTALLGDRITVNQVSVNAAKVTVTYVTRPDGVPFSTPPSVPVTKTFVLSDNKLVPQ